MTPAGAVSTFVISGLDGPFGLAFDATGNLYVANFGNNTISKVTPALAVTAVSPAAGPSAGGTEVTITGSNFTGATGVYFGTTPATNVIINSNAQITATSPAGSGTVDVRVTGPGGTSTTSPADQFTYVTLGIDVSAHQTSVSWPSVAAAGYSFAFIKASQGDRYEDPIFAAGQRMPAAATALNNYVAVYDFADPDEYSDPTKYLKINPNDSGSVNADAVAEANEFFNVGERIWWHPICDLHLT